MKKFTFLMAVVLGFALNAMAQNPFAYNVAGEYEDAQLTVTCDLNAVAQSVVVNILKADDKTVAKTQTFTETVAGVNTFVVDAAGLEEGEYTFELSVLGDTTLTQPVALNNGPLCTSGTIWSPYGIGIDNNVMSPHYGRILVNESQTSVPSNYWTGHIGLYEFTPRLEPVVQPDGNKYITGGVNFAGFCPDGSTRAFTTKKVRVSKDGRIFVGVCDAANNPIYELNPDDLSQWTPIFGGTKDAMGDFRDADSALIAGPSVAFDVLGEGENLRLVNLSCTGGQVLAYSAFKTNEYPLGTATSWNAAVAPENQVAPLTGQYTISAQSVSIAYDQDGNIWYAQYRGTPNETQPAIKHFSRNAAGEWVEDYSDITTVVRGGGIAFSPDYRYLAIPRGNNLLGIYEVVKAEGAISLNLVYTINPSSIRGFNDLAWDNAYNIYGCDNGKEVFVQMQIPRKEATVTPAREEFNFTVIPGEKPAPFSILFACNSADSDSGTAFTTSSSIAEIFAAGADHVAAITATDKVYPARSSIDGSYGIKFGSSSATGTMTFTLSEEIYVEKIIAISAGYGDSEYGNFSVNGTVIAHTAEKAVNKKWQNDTIEVNAKVSAITIAQLTASKGRFYFKGLTIIPGEEPEATINYWLVGTAAENGWDQTAAMPMAGDQIVRHLAAGTYEFKVLTQEGSWTGALGFANLNAEASSANVFGDDNVVFELENEGDVTIKVVEGQIVVLGTFKEQVVADYYIKFAGNNWTWVGMTQAPSGVYMYEGVWGGVGANVNTSMSDNGATWYPVENIFFGTEELEPLDVPAVGTVGYYVYIPDAEPAPMLAFLYEGTPTGLNNREANIKAVKFMENGRILIRKGDAVYTVTGVRIR